MTVAELKKKIEKLPDHMDVVIKKEETEYPLSPVESAEVKMCSFGEEPTGKAMAKDKCLVLSDEE